MAHLHITTWVVAIILLFVVTSMYKNKKKAATPLHMILRLDYLIILYSGGSLFAEYTKMSGELILKVIAGLLTIVAIEMITVKAKKQKSASAWWIVFVISALVAILLGFTRLPLGVLP